MRLMLEIHERPKKALESMVKRMAAEAMVSMSNQDYEAKRDKMMEGLRELSDNYNSIALYGDKRIREIRLDSVDKRIEALAKTLGTECEQIVTDIKKGLSPRLGKMKEMDKQMELLLMGYS